jgi:hypothetical protein
MLSDVYCRSVSGDCIDCRFVLHADDWREVVDYAEFGFSDTVRKGLFSKDCGTSPSEKGRFLIESERRLSEGWIE